MRLYGELCGQGVRRFGRLRRSVQQRELPERPNLRWWRRGQSMRLHRELRWQSLRRCGWLRRGMHERLPDSGAGFDRLRRHAHGVANHGRDRRVYGLPELGRDVFVNLLHELGL